MLPSGELRLRGKQITSHAGVAVSRRSSRVGVIYELRKVSRAVRAAATGSNASTA